jgi:hypothetical protein
MDDRALRVSVRAEGHCPDTLLIAENTRPDHVGFAPRIDLLYAHHENVMFYDLNYDARLTYSDPYRCEPEFSRAEEQHLSRQNR